MLYVDFRISNAEDRFMATTDRTKGYEIFLSYAHKADVPPPDAPQGTSLCFSAHVLCRCFLIRENPWFPWLQNDPGANCLRSDKSQKSEPRNTRNFTDETAPHTVSFLTRNRIDLPVVTLRFGGSAGCFFVSSCEIRSSGRRLGAPAKNRVAGGACSKPSRLCVNYL